MTTYHYSLTKYIKIAIMFANDIVGMTEPSRGNYATTLEEINAGY